MNNDELVFQVIDISSDDVSLGGDYWDKEFLLTFYGKTSEGLNVVCNVGGYKPYFYIRIPNKFGRSFTRRFLKMVYNSMNDNSNNYQKWNGNYLEDELTVNRYYNFYGYNYNIECDKVNQYKFAKISFLSY